MLEFCPHCGETLGGQDPHLGLPMTCRSCGGVIGVVTAEDLPGKEPALPEDAIRCSQCGQLVEIKTSPSGRSVAPHFRPGERKVCPGSGKPAVAGTQPSTAPIAAGGKDLSAFYNVEKHKIIACLADREPTIEVIELQYLDRSDRVRVQVDAIRDILGSRFRLEAYPEELGRPHLAMWVGPTGCVVAKRSPAGGYESIDDAELAAVIEELRSHRSRFA